MVPFLLTYVPSHTPLPPAVPAQAELEATEKFWQSWVSACRPTGPWSEVVQRSLITLKALTYAPTGGIVAAPTTSLPEQLGGERNWDYRFCWLRDATMTLLALMNAGFHEAAQAWNPVALRAIAGSPEQLQVMYGLAGERRIIEWKASWLSGYERSRPVRIGNAAYRQRQLDVYGESSTPPIMCMAKSSTPPIKRAAAVLPWTSPVGPCNWRCSIISRRSGKNRIAAFGKFAAARSASPIRGLWRGLHSTAPLRALKCSALTDQSIGGGKCAPTFMQMSVHTASMPRLAASFSATAPPTRCKPAAAAGCRIPADQ